MTLATADGRALTPGRALAYGAAAVGAIDFLYATIFVVIRGRPWYRPWQGVASAVLGADSFAEGYRSALLGVFLHFAVATCIVGVYLIASRWFPILRQRALLWGLAYGVAAFFVMNLVVVPLTRIGASRWSGPPSTWADSSCTFSSWARPRRILRVVPTGRSIERPEIHLARGGLLGPQAGHRIDSDGPEGGGQRGCHRHRRQHAGHAERPVCRRRAPR